MSSSDMFEYKATSVLVPLNLLIFIGIVAFHVITIRKHVKSDAFTGSLVLSYLLLLISFYGYINRILNIFDPFQTITFCAYVQYFRPAGYLLFKLTLYLVLIYRLHEAFSSSLLAYNKRKLQIWAAVLIFMQLFNIIAGAMMGHHILDKKALPHCIWGLASVSYAFTILLDFVACIVCSYLFTKPILTLRAWFKDTTNGQNNQNMETKDLEYVAIKQCILSLIGIGSTILTLGLSVIFRPKVFGAVLISMDVNISCLCIIFMHSWNSKVVDIIFYCCLPSRVETELAMTVSNSASNKQTAKKQPVTAQTPTDIETGTPTNISSNEIV